MKLKPRFRPRFELTWFFDGRSHRVTCWPEVEFQVRTEKGWKTVATCPALFAAAALALAPGEWTRYLPFVPDRERSFLETFRFGRLQALEALARCPRLLPILEETPALTAFVAAHAGLRGVPGPRWAEIDAVTERGGVYRLLEWLGLPAERSTLAVLRNLADPDVPKRLLRPLRSTLWHPAKLERLLRPKTDLSDVQLSRYCQARAA